MENGKIDGKENKAELEERFRRKLEQLLNAEDLSKLPQQLIDVPEDLPDLGRWR